MRGALVVDGVVVHVLEARDALPQWAVDRGYLPAPDGEPVSVGWTWRGGRVFDRPPPAAVLADPDAVEARVKALEGAKGA